MTDKLYRVVDDEGNVYDNRWYTYGGAQIRPFTSLSRAKAARTKHQKNNNYASHYADHKPRTFTIQETDAEWRDVAE